MRNAVMTVCLVMLLPAGTAAQEVVRSSSPTPISDSITRLSAASAASLGPALHRRSQARHGNLKGALIGAAIGVGLTTYLIGYCEGDCIRPYITGALVLGGIGAGLGALVSPSRNWPTPSRHEPVVVR